MKIKVKVNKSRAQVAWEYAKDGGIPVDPVMIDGYAIFFPELNEFWRVWRGSEHPFGVEAWKGLRKEFGRYVETSENSIHRGSQLPANGIAVLDCGDFSVVLRQMIDDNLAWLWHWEPIAIVADPE